MPVTIRPALPEDSKQIAAIAKEMNDLHAERLPRVFQPDSSEQVEREAKAGDQKGMMFCRRGGDGGCRSDLAYSE